ncbi:hemoglobin/transferrin/lactoferrin receptor protein [Pseudoduganella flava]|uniref:Hemoglobin/transferrin/lactoferrin receptor protein n=1 Tax=Pseudoduganella flava TaxID=871742 RepID=A0A562PT77_9BURK|nr:TonB-dependent receptor [Pseudoduganella flava]QGZ39150.1 TonB-dependent receptor [Pseudoduganella flava]TWI47563.1 hemoglobin/transferrin/lactoferrin receptor protein [Pseudoduganella flava]
MDAHLARRRLLPALLMSALAPLGHAQTTTSTTTTALGEILVTARRDEAPAGTKTVLSAAELARQGAQDMRNIARYAPLISVPNAASGSGSVWDSTGNTGFNIRGIDGNRVSMDVDGIALPDAAPKPDGTSLNTFGIGRDYFDPETFREVSITSGTTATGPGTPGLGGAVALVTKAPEDYVSKEHPVHADYKFGYDGSNHMRMHALTGAADMGGMQLLALFVHRDGKEYESAGNTVQNPDDWDSDALLAKLSWYPLAGHKVTATIDAYQASHVRDYLNKVSALYPQGVDQQSDTRRSRFSLDHEFTGKTALFDRLDSRIYAQNAEVDDRTDAYYVSGGQRYQRAIDTGYFNRSRGIASNAVKEFGAHRLSYGIAAEDVETRRPWREDRTVLATGTHQITNKNRMVDTDTTKLWAFARAELALTDSLTLTPGLRYDWRELEPKNVQDYVVAVPAAQKELRTRKDDYFTPSLELAYKLRPDLTAYAKYSRGTRLPTAAEMTGTYDSFSYTGAGTGYAVLGNADLKKETSNAFELGVRGEAVPGVSIQAAAFHTKYRNFIEYAEQPLDLVNYPTITQFLYRPENVGSAKTWGAEVSAQFALKQWSAALNGASVTVAAGVQHSKARNEETGVEGELASTLPRKISATFAWDDPAKRGGAALSVFSVHGKEAKADVIAGTTTARFAVPGATVADLTAYWNIGKHASVTAGIYNLTDKQYWDYASSRSLAAGTTATALADIERQARPGRYGAVTFKVIY